LGAAQAVKATTVAGRGGGRQGEQQARMQCRGAGVRYSRHRCRRHSILRVPLQCRTSRVQEVQKRCSRQKSPPAKGSYFHAIMSAVLARPPRRTQIQRRQAVVVYRNRQLYRQSW